MRRRIVARDRRVRGTRQHRTRGVGKDGADGHLTEPLGLAGARQRLLDDWNELEEKPAGEREDDFELDEEE